MSFSELLRVHDESILIMFAGVLSAVMNWYAWPQARARRILTIVPLIACPIIMLLEFVK